MRALLLALSFVLIVSTAQAMNPNAPDMFLRGVYDHYIGEYAHGIKLGSDKELRNVFTPDLVRLIKADRRHAKGEVPLLDGDPLVDAQEWKISRMRIDIENESPAGATATAHFNNFDKETSVTLLLVKMKAGWRVNEIIGPSGSLRKLLTSSRF